MGITVNLRSIEMFKHLLSISLMITAGSAMAAQGIDAVNCTGDQIEIYGG